MPDLGHLSCWRSCHNVALDSTRGVSQRGEKGRWDKFRMNLVVIEEHQVGDLVFAQLYYLYILLRPHRPVLLYQ